MDYKILWYGWRQDAAKHFSVSPRTIDNWFERSEPSLIEWLEKELKRRKIAFIKANEIKKGEYEA